LGKKSKVSGQKDTKIEMKKLRSQQTATIAKVLDGMKHHLPTIQEIIGAVWSTFPQKRRLDLRVLGRAIPFCDGVGVPRTAVTSTE
jgi:hypothetical protein